MDVIAGSGAAIYGAPIFLTAVYNRTSRRNDNPEDIYIPARIDASASLQLWMYKLAEDGNDDTGAMRASCVSLKRARRKKKPPKNSKKYKDIIATLLWEDRIAVAKLRLEEVESHIEKVSKDITQTIHQLDEIDGSRFARLYAELQEARSRSEDITGRLQGDRRYAESKLSLLEEDLRGLISRTKIFMALNCAQECTAVSFEEPKPAIEE